MTVQQYVNGGTNCCTQNIAAQIEQKRAGRRKLVRHGGTLCSKCLEVPPTKGQKYCPACHAAYEKARRASLKACAPIKKGRTAKSPGIFTIPRRIRAISINTGNRVK